MVRRIGRFGRAHPVVAGLVVTGVALLGVAGATAWTVWRELDVERVEISYVVPTAPRLAAETPGQTVYRIDAARSSVSYEVDEQLAGASRTATGSTSGVAGDIRIDSADPAASTVGQIVVDVSQLTSDQELRDQRLQHDFLEAQDFPLATLDTTAVDGLPDRIEPDVEYGIELTGDLTVKETTAPVTFTGTARLTGDELVLDATTDTLLSTFDVGPIELLGFVKTGDEVRLTVSVVAVDVAAGEVPSAVAAPAAEPNTSGDGPSFAATVQPVLEQRCATCHNPGGVGSDIWRLDTAGDAGVVAEGLGLVTSAGYMPPFPASELGVPVRHRTTLTPEQVAAVAAWADAGGPLDVDPTTPVRPAPSDVPPLPRDRELRLAEPYQGSVEVVNDYRCFVLDPGFTDTAFVSGFGFEPDQAEIVHHALAFRVRASGSDALAARDAADPGPGWQCYVGVGTGGIVGAPGSDATQFMSWAPGQDPSRFPDGVGLRMDAGDQIVVQIHYHFEHRAPADRSTMVLDLADGDPATMQETSHDVYLAPAEIPCARWESGPLCDRNAVIDQLVADYGPAAAGIANGLHLLCGTRPEDFAGMTDGLAGASCDHVIRRPREVLGVFGHMHEIGSRFRMTLNPGRPDEQVLLDIPRWSFDWQLNYEPVDPVVLDPGDVLRVECEWDRSRMVPARPRYVTWAEGTEDEMCYSTITSRPPETAGAEP
jgi:polyisoprenoid-binding protein YceI/mono/diheme cytochrome c family protein